VNVFKVPDSLEAKYTGAGCALAASLNGQLIDIVYVGDVITDFSGNVQDLAKIIVDARLGPTIRRLQALGEVHIGMLGGWEFTEL
jgi:hypothetical protein